MLKELFPGSTDFTMTICKIPQLSKHLSATLNPVSFPTSPRLGPLDRFLSALGVYQNSDISNTGYNEPPLHQFSISL